MEHWREVANHLKALRRLTTSPMLDEKTGLLHDHPLLNYPGEPRGGGGGVLDVHLLLEDQARWHTTELMVLSQYVHLVLSLQHVLVYGHHVTWVGVEELT